jgi:glycosyltransferase involved in cell wall biosynthesis
MKLVHIIPSLAFAGAEKQVASLAIEAQKRGINTTVVTFFKTDGFQDDLIDRNIKFYCLGYSGLFSLPKVIIKLTKYINKLKPNIVHSHMVNSILISRVFLGNKKYKLFETLHCTPKEIKKLGFILLRWTQLKSSFTSCVSKDMLNGAIEYQLSKKIGYIPNAVDDSFFESKNTVDFSSVDIEFKWVSIGRLIDKKGFDILISSCETLKRKGIQNFSLDIYGDGPLKSELQNQINNANLEQVILLKGIEKNISKIIHKYHGFVSSSKIEAFGIVIIESLAKGLPVCLTDCDGPIEIIGVAEKCGLLVKKNNKNSLARGMGNMMNLDKLKLEKMSYEAQKMVKEKYNQKNIFNQWIEHYNEK